jgi:hypothetical protein
MSANSGNQMIAAISAQYIVNSCCTIPSKMLAALVSAQKHLVVIVKPLLALLRRGISYQCISLISGITILVIAGIVYFLYCHTNECDGIFLTNINISDEFQDPVTLQLFINPGIIECGHTFEYSTYISLLENKMFVFFFLYIFFHIFFNILFNIGHVRYVDILLINGSQIINYVL